MSTGRAPLAPSMDWRQRGRNNTPALVMHAKAKIGRMGPTLAGKAYFSGATKSLHTPGRFIIVPAHGAVSLRMARANSLRARYGFR